MIPRLTIPGRSWVVDAGASPQQQRAFEALSRRFALKPAAAELLCEIAQGVGVPAVALLVSEHAFDRAVVSAGEHARREEAVARLRDRLFGQA